MSTVEEIKEAITKLPAKERDEVVAWFYSWERRQDIEMDFDDQAFERLSKLPKSASDIAYPEDDDL